MHSSFSSVYVDYNAVDTAWSQRSRSDLVMHPYVFVPSGSGFRHRVCMHIIYIYIYKFLCFIVFVLDHLSTPILFLSGF